MKDILKILKVKFFTKHWWDLNLNPNQQFGHFKLNSRYFCNKSGVKLYCKCRSVHQGSNKNAVSNIILAPLGSRNMLIKQDIGNSIFTPPTLCTYIQDPIGCKYKKKGWPGWS